MSIMQNRKKKKRSRKDKSKTNIEKGQMEDKMIMQKRTVWGHRMFAYHWIVVVNNALNIPSLKLTYSK